MCYFYLQIGTKYLDCLSILKVNVEQSCSHDGRSCHVQDLHFLCRFPNDPTIKKQWVVACKRLKIGKKNKIWQPNRSTVVCSDHFKPVDYSTVGCRRRLLATAVPSRFKFRKDSSVPSSRHIRYITNYGQVPVIASTSTDIADGAVMERLRKARRDLKNSKRREKRLKDTVDSLRTLLMEELAVKESLLAKLKSYKGVYCV